MIYLSSAVKGYLSCFQFGAITNSTSMSIPHTYSTQEWGCRFCICSAWVNTIKQFLKELYQFTLLSAMCNSGPQPFWHQGLVSWKTIFPQMVGDGGWGDGSGSNASDGERWGAVDEALVACPPLTSCCAAQFLTGLRPVPVHGAGLGDHWCRRHHCTSLSAHNIVCIFKLILSGRCMVVSCSFHLHCPINKGLITLSYVYWYSWLFSVVKGLFKVFCPFLYWLVCLFLIYFSEFLSIFWIWVLCQIYVLKISLPCLPFHSLNGDF